MKEQIAKLIFDEIELAIKKTASPTPTPISESQLLKELKKIKKKYLKE